MARVFVKPNFFLGLYCFLRQIELSLDRFDRWEKLLEYFSKRTPITKVIDVLEVLLNKKNDSFTCRSNFAIRDTFINKLFQYTFSHFGRRPFLYSEEIEYIHYLLGSVSHLLSGIEKPKQDYINELRVKLRFCYEGFRFRLHEATIKKGNSIEHYNQNSNSQCYSLEEIAGCSWLQWQLSINRDRC